MTERREVTIAGQEVTRRTLVALSRHERGRTGTMARVIIYFDGRLPDDADYFRPSGTLAEHREALLTATGKHRDGTQERTREFLRGDPRARDCFASLTGFQGDPLQFVESLSVPNVMFARANCALVELLTRLPNIQAIQLDKSMRLLSISTTTPSCPERGAEHKNGYTWGWNHLKIPTFHRHGWQGQGQEIGMIDTGACPGHPDLNGKIIDYCAVDDVRGNIGKTGPPEDHHPSGHGTHVAGILVGGDNASVHIGGAPLARLRVVSLTTTAVAIWFSHFMKAAERLYGNPNGVKLINVSMGFPSLPVYAHDEKTLEDAIRQTLRQRVLFVAAIGNLPGVSHTPGRLNGILSAGSHHPDGHTWFRSGRNPSLSLPGTSVFSCLPVKGRGSQSGNSYDYRDGTSKAAAHLTALAALLMEAFPHVAPWEIGDALLRTANNSQPRFDLAADFLNAKYP